MNKEKKGNTQDLIIVGTIHVSTNESFMPRNKLPSHYGALTCVKVTDIDHLLMIVDELGDEMRDNLGVAAFPSEDGPLPPGFYHNRAWIIDAYKQGCLFGLQVSENYAMYQDKDSRMNPIFMKKRRAWPFSVNTGQCDFSHSIPCFAVVNDKAGGKEKECSLVWVAERARNYGFGSRMMDDCRVTHASDVLVESTGFWDKIGFSLDRERQYECTYVRKNAPHKKAKR